MKLTKTTIIIIKIKINIHQVTTQYKNGLNYDRERGVACHIHVIMDGCGLSGDL